MPKTKNGIQICIFSNGAQSRIFVLYAPDLSRLKALPERVLTDTETYTQMTDRHKDIYMKWQ